MGERQPFEFGIMRHAPKVEQSGGENVAEASVDLERVGDQGRQVAESLLQELEAAPTGTILALEPSTVDRAEQTRELLVRELEQLVDQTHADITLVTLGEGEGAESQLAMMQAAPNRKFIITDVRGSWLLGLSNKEAYMPAVKKWKKVFGEDETALAKLWAAHPDELSELKKEMEARGIALDEPLRPGEFITTPEDRAVRQLHWMQGMERIGQTRFPERPLRLEAVSHNMISDFTVLALLGEPISVESINRVLGGELRKPFERSVVQFLPNGNVRVAYRDRERILSQEEFMACEQEMRRLSQERKDEWAR